VSGVLFPVVVRLVMGQAHSLEIRTSYSRALGA
jgi:hypothetical protein